MHATCCLHRHDPTTLDDQYERTQLLIKMLHKMVLHEEQRIFSIKCNGNGRERKTAV
jgi:hypothetical protein